MSKKNYSNIIRIEKHEIDEEFIQDNYDRINWWYLSQSDINFDICKQFKDKINWSVYFDLNRKWVNVESVIEVQKYIDWGEFTRSFIYNIDEKMILKFKDKLDINYLVEKRELNTKLINEIQEYVDWSKIDSFEKFKNLKLSTIEKYIAPNYSEDDFFWTELCLTYKLTEKFINKHIKKFNIEDLMLKQNLGKKFIKENLEEIKKHPDFIPYLFINNKKLDYEVIQLFDIIEENPESFVNTCFYNMHYELPSELFINNPEVVNEIYDLKSFYTKYKFDMDSLYAIKKDIDKENSKLLFQNKYIKGDKNLKAFIDLNLL